MKIGFNIQKIYEYINESFNQVILDLLNFDKRISALENRSGSEWVEITSTNGQEAEITQEFSEIRLLAKCTNANYSVTYSYDSTIFHNSSSNAPTYMICGNPTENNYGCKFKYMVTTNGKQYVCVDKCFNGGGYDAFEFRAWIKPVQNETQ